MNTEAICYLLRKTNLTLKEIGKLTSQQFMATIKEVQRQESREEYNKNYRTASLMAAIYNTIPRKSYKALTAKDFLSGEPPSREGKKPDTNVEILAKQKGIILPSK